MAKFSKGLLLGTLVGGTIGLLTTKKTGSQRIHDLSHYLGSIAIAGGEVQSSLVEVKEAMADLTHELETTAKSAAEDINSALDTFQFEAEPRIKQINAEVADLNDSLDQIKPS